ncbi:MAG: histidine phosphatase family protein [Candidatus Pacebacteria bacterium]|nr:histidine phosphatase family protein [Candidatus Paceibacterota bacterium]
MQEEQNKDYCTLWIVKHGQTEWNLQGIIQGQKDSNLTELGIKQAEKTANKLKNIHFDAIFSSDSGRAIRTAEIIKLDRDITIQTSQLLRERNFGKFEGQQKYLFQKELIDKIQERNKLAKEEYEKYKLADDIESDDEVVVRFMIQLREIAVAYPDKQILIVTHSDCIKNFLIRTGYKERQDLLKSSFKNGGHIKVLSDGINFFIKEVDGIYKKTEETK